jgi:LysR family transcriptional regulator, chromosome initiation inhibitor
VDLDRRQTEALLAVIETGSFDKAAGRLHVTQSAVSQRVRALESLLGGPLVVRSRPCRATPQGQRLLRFLRRAALLEQELAAEWAPQGAATPHTIALAINADTLGTWFLPAVAPLLMQQNLMLDVTVDDQDHTFALLEAGSAVGCVTSQSRPMRGCVAESLGTMRYRMVATPAFVARWFAGGFAREAARHAPVMVFNRKDALQADFLMERFGLAADAYPCHYMPSNEAFFAAIRGSMGYGLVPELQCGDALAQGEVVDLAPENPVDVALYWHAWKVQSPRLEALTASIVEAARQALSRRLVP